MNGIVFEKRNCPSGSGTMQVTFPSSTWCVGQCPAPPAASTGAGRDIGKGNDSSTHWSSSDQ